VSTATKTKKPKINKKDDDNTSAADEAQKILDEMNAKKNDDECAFC
jgi:hypothetical protein